MVEPAASPASSQESLAEYRAKRQFDRTPEPAGGPPVSADGHRFVVQRHRARRLHYDLRFEIDGVLVSWAVPKGPTLDPSAKRLAVHVEDHPIEYFDFEGVIPGGEYGGGDVIVWDWGTWDLHGAGDARRAVADGDFHADLHGERLNGRIALVRRGEDRAGKEQWLLMHKRDEFARDGWDAEDHPTSVKSGRTNDEVAAAPEALWDPGRDVPSWTPPTDDELTALDTLGRGGTWTFQGRELRLTNLDKVLFPARGDEPPSTKRDLIRYYSMIAPTALPYLYDRPINTRRHPNGVESKGFWQKSVPNHAPGWITRWNNEEADPGETEWYVVADSPPTLAWLANYGVIEMHPWTSTAGAMHEPSFALIDIDPGSATTFDDVLTLARLYRTALDHVGTRGWPKVSGRRGIQIWVPIDPGYDFEQTRAWVESLSRAVGNTVPDLVSWEWEVGKREGRARLDYTQNAINKTLVAPYSVRAAAGAPVSVPIEWDELDDEELCPDWWTIRTVFDRLREHGDPFRPMLDAPQRLPDL
jgi:bifunctional non-homologous end joining protein LigD